MTIKAFTEATLFDGTGAKPVRDTVVLVEDRVGTLEPGKLADLIVVEGDPLKDMKVPGDKANIRLIVKGGAVAVDRGL